MTCCCHTDLCDGGDRVLAGIEVMPVVADRRDSEGVDGVDCDGAFLGVSDNGDG